MKRSQEQLDDLALVAFAWFVALGVVATAALVALSLAHGEVI